MRTTTQKKGLLENAFSSHRWDSRIHSANTTRAEMWLGYVFSCFYINILYHGFFSRIMVY